MRVCLLGTYERDYPRNQIIINGLKDVGVDFFECHIDFWKHKPHKVSLLKNPIQLSFAILRFAYSYLVLILRYLNTPKHDAVLFLYPGHLDIVALGWLAKLRARTIVFDCFISLYDTAVSDRKLTRPNSISGQILKLIDQTACATADRIALDTNAHIDYFVNSLRVERRKMVRIFAGADTKLFSDCNLPKNRSYFKVLFIGKFTPLHGIDVILDAADRLRTHPNIQFVFIGTGQLFDEHTKKYSHENSSNVKFLGWIPYERLPKAVYDSDLCLGIFSNSDKANRVIPNKIFQAIACGKPVLTARTTACMELFEDERTIFYVSSNNSQELADKILSLASDSKKLDLVAAAGKKLIRSVATTEIIGSKFKDLILNSQYASD